MDDILKMCNEQGLAVCKWFYCEIFYGCGRLKGGGESYGGSFALHICGAKHQAKLKVSWRPRKFVFLESLHGDC